MTTDLSNRISNMSLLCALMVVVLHMAGSPVVGHPTWWTHRIFGVGFFGIAVPFFFLVSGFFVESRYLAGGSYGQIVRKRVRTLLVPFLIWNLLYAAFVLGTICVVDLTAHRPIGTNIPVTGWHWLSLLGLYPFSEPYLGPTWYIRGLLLIVLVSPLLRVLLTKSGWWTLAILFLVMYFTMAYYPSGSTSYKFWRWTVPTTGFFYFALGMWLRRHPVPDNLGRRLAFVVLPFGVAVQLIEVYLLYRGVECPVYWRGIMIPLVMGGVWYLIPPTPLPNYLRGMAFPIYVLHYFFITAVFFVNHDPNSIIFYLARGFCGIVGPFVLVLLMRKYVPGFSRVAFGGR
jgi:peptidoglycan/LPS O-acetylase OafA/YrhL